MRTLMLAAFVALFTANTAFAATCADTAAEKKLAGAAKTSFMKKCETDAKPQAMAPAGNADCDAKAAEKKIYGAAKASFLKKCVADAKK
jgi:flagellar motor protein MotB